MQLVLTHYCCCWTITVHTTTQQQFTVPKNRMSLCSASHHTLHELQTLDTSVFGPLKRNWGDVYRKFMQQPQVSNCNKIPGFFTLFGEAWMKMMVSKNIIDKIASISAEGYVSQKSATQEKPKG